jgi:glycosyltransferase involved in cell wall biosynthesis
MKHRLNIAIMGTRGIPANYGGFETFAEELATRLVARGHRVTVYGRAHYVKETKRFYRGVELVILPTIRTKYFDTVAHTFASVLHGLFRRYDLVLICNAANTIFSPILRIAGKKVIVNVDGIERKRRKWNWLGRSYYHLSEWLSTFLPNEIVTDAKAIKEYYWKSYGKDSYLIPYGANATVVPSNEILKKYDLAENQYVLYVSRLEPENNARLVVKAFEKVRTDCKLVIVGDAPYSKKYIEEIRETKDPRILFAGGVYGRGYWELLGHALCYIHATEVGGTHPALIEAMAQSNCILVNGTVENIEVVDDTAIVFKNDVEDLTAKLQRVLDRPADFDKYRRKAKERAIKFYAWDPIVDQYEELFYKVLNVKRET